MVAFPSYAPAEMQLKLPGYPVLVNLWRATGGDDAATFQWQPPDGNSDSSIRQRVWSLN
jgi:hypothetical protein